MVMSYFKNPEVVVDNQLDAMPKWVSKSNSSFRAWRYVEDLIKEKMLYIKRHNKRSDFIIQKHYLIKGSDVASALNINRSSLMNTSAYSIHFKNYLDKVNADLISAKDLRLNRFESTKARGSIRSSKDELLISNELLKKRVDELERLNVEKIVLFAYDNLPLPVRNKIGLE